MLKEYATACGLAHIKLNDLRRFFGPTIVAKTGDMRKAEKWLRDKSIETTARYYILDEVDPIVSESLYGHPGAGMAHGTSSYLLHGYEGGRLHQRHRSSQ